MDGSQQSAQGQATGTLLAGIGSGMGVGNEFTAAGRILSMLMMVDVLATWTVVSLRGCYGVVGGALVGLGRVVLTIGRPQQWAVSGIAALGGEDKGV